MNESKVQHDEQRHSILQLQFTASFTQSVKRRRVKPGSAAAATAPADTNSWPTCQPAIVARSLARSLARRC